MLLLLLLVNNLFAAVPLLNSVSVGGLRKIFNFEEGYRNKTKQHDRRERGKSRVRGRTDNNVPVFGPHANLDLLITSVIGGFRYLHSEMWK